MSNDLIMNTPNSRDVGSFYSDDNVVEPLIFKTIQLRTEAQYDADIYAEKTAMSYIEKIVNAFESNVYLLTVSQDVINPSKLRTKKGVLWGEKGFRGLDYRNGEFDVNNGRTRLYSLVNLDGLNYDKPEPLVLNWISSLILFTKMDIDFLNNYVGNWLSHGKEIILPFNHNALAQDLLLLNTTAIMHYFPADNGRNEILALVGNKSFINETLIGHIENTKCKRRVQTRHPF